MLDIKNVYITIRTEKYSRKKLEIHTAIAMAYLDPTQLAYALTNAPRYSARIRGEAAQLYRCTPVPARIRSTEDCFQELPVTVNGNPMYLKPRTRMITSKGTKITCDPDTTAMYHLKDKWYILFPEINTAAKTPETLNEKTLPWGRKQEPLKENSKENVEKDTTPINQEAPEKKKASSQPRNKSATQEIITVIIAISVGLTILTAVIIRKKRKTKMTTTAENRKYTYHYAYEDEDDESDKSSLHTISSHLETLLRRPPQNLPMDEGRHEISSEIADLRISYRRLEERVNRISHKI